MTPSRRQFLGLAGAALLGGCFGVPEQASDHGWGKQGRRLGEFLRPRAIGIHDGEVFVIDMSGRVQVFDEAGTFLRYWPLEKTDNGTPTAITFHDDGRILIPDTHNSRVLEYDREGNLLTHWGSFGTDAGHFIYPTGLALGPKNEFILSEYGNGAERVHIFDADRKFLRQWGQHGEASGEFNRAMAIGRNSLGEIFVADTANHRVQVFDIEGTWLRNIGRSGMDPGQLKYPHDMTVAADDTVYVAEYGTHRVSRFDREGTLIEIFGEAGRAPGQLNAPRGVAVSTEGRVYVADTDNDRVQVFNAKQVTT